MVVIRESDMCFGEYTEEQVFVIEKSTQYYEKLRPNGIKSCEFILRREDIENAAFTYALCKVSSGTVIL